jgi:DMSO/TMAO reductase YedYZ molybdopterin-dependent catalytic subunit
MMPENRQSGMFGRVSKVKAKGKARIRAFVAGAVGAILAFGVAELAHGLYAGVPSIFLAIAQGIIELTPGSFATRAIETLGQADIPILISSTVVGALAVAGLLTVLSLRSRIAAIVGVAALAAIALLAAFSEPSFAPAATVITVVAGIGLGVVAAEFLLRSSGLRPESSPELGEDVPPTMDVRSREAHSRGTMALGRRNFLLLSGAAAAAGLAAAGVGRTLSSGRAEQAGTRRVQVPQGSAASHQTLPPPPADASIDVPGMPPLTTPAKDFYLIDTVLTSPRVDAATWTLTVGGAVSNPLKLSYDDLLSMSTREADVTLSCVSNEVGGGLISNGRWTGVLLSDVLKEAGVSPGDVGRGSGAEQLVGRSVDGWTSGFKTELALDGREALVAFGLNGNELPVEHGYPVRLVVPGIYGYVSATKWLTEIELTDWDFDAYWIQRTWSKEGPIKTQSRIDTVKSGDDLQAGAIPIGGVAWAPHRGIGRVEVSTDGGESWNEARLAAQLDDDTWRQYVYDWDARPGEHTLQVRATDGDGQTQTARETPPHPNGASGYHTVDVTVA